MRELTTEETLLVSGGEYLDWHTKNAISDFMKIALKPSKIFYGKFDASMFTFPTPEQIEENIRIWQEQQGNTPAPQPSAPPIMWDGSGGGFSWDHHVNLH